MLGNPDRATTLPNQTRYQTALCPGKMQGVHASPKPGKQSAPTRLMPAKHRKCDPVARSNAQFFRSTADDFQNGANRSVRRNKTG